MTAHFVHHCTLEQALNRNIELSLATPKQILKTWNPININSLLVYIFRSFSIYVELSLSNKWIWRCSIYLPMLCHCRDLWGYWPVFQHYTPLRYVYQRGLNQEPLGWICGFLYLLVFYTLWGFYNVNEFIYGLQPVNSLNRPTHMQDYRIIMLFIFFHLAI